MDELYDLYDPYNLYDLYYVDCDLPDVCNRSDEQIRRGRGRTHRSAELSELFPNAGSQGEAKRGEGNSSAGGNTGRRAEQAGG